MNYHEIESRIWKMKDDSFDIEQLEKEIVRYEEELIKMTNSVKNFSIAAQDRIKWLNIHIKKCFSLDLVKGTAYNFDGGGVEYRLNIQPYYVNVVGNAVRDVYNDGSYGDKYRGQSAQFEALTNMVKIMIDNPNITRIKIEEKLLDKLEKMVKKNCPDNKMTHCLGLVEEERDRWKKIHIAWGR
jgi:hypothetical protein